MSRFFNMLPGEESCCILLYGDIGDHDKVRSGDIARELLEAEADFKKIDARINSMGGDVYAGIAIFNAFRNSQADITLYIDGVAASIASVIVSCGKRVEASKYARLMIHSVAGGCYGNKAELLNTIKEIEALEETLCAIYASKTGKTEEEIREMFFDGKDHWLTAQEALDLGLIDGIYDADPIPEDSTPEQVFAHYQNKFNSPNIENMFTKIKTRPAFKNFATEEEALTYISELEEKAAKVDDLEKEVAELTNKLSGYVAKAQADEEKEIEDLVETAYDEERITEPEKDIYKNLLKADRKNGEAALKARPAKKRVMNNLHKPSGGGNVGAWERRQEEIRNKTKR